MLPLLALALVMFGITVVLASTWELVCAETTATLSLSDPQTEGGTHFGILRMDTYHIIDDGHYEYHPSVGT